MFPFNNNLLTNKIQELLEKSSIIINIFNDFKNITIKYFTSQLFIENYKLSSGQLYVL